MDAGTILGVIGVLATAWAAFDARRQRSKREKAVIAAHAVIERTHGLLIGIKPSLSPGSQVKAIDDGLEAIKAQRSALADL